MIEVEFIADKDQDWLEWLEIVRPNMPWIDYLMKYCYDIQVTSIYEAPTHQNIFRYHFYLPEKHEI